MENYRNLTEDEILRLKSQSCLADDWEKVRVADGFSTEFVHHTRFSGEVKLGVFQGEFILPGGIARSKTFFIFNYFTNKTPISPQLIIYPFHGFPHDESFH